MLSLLQQPWPWYIAGPLIGLTVPALLLMGNKSFGISASLRHICAACLPAGIPFFTYNWKKEWWNLFFVIGILAGGCIAGQWLSNPAPLSIHPQLAVQLAAYGITDTSGVIPAQLFSWHQLLTARGLVMMVGGGFLVGFGARYAGGCTSGHAITGLSSLQWPSLVATACFMTGGWLVTHFVLPVILSL